MFKVWLSFPVAAGRNMRLFRFARAEDGSVSIEIMLWSVALMAVMSLIVDATTIFYSQAQMMRIVQDTNRAYSVGNFASTNDAESYILSRTGGNVLAVSVEENADGDLVTTTLVMPASELAVLGMFAPLNNLELGFSAAHLIEG